MMGHRFSRSMSPAEVVRIGRLLRVPRAALEAWAGPSSPLPPHPPPCVAGTGAAYGRTTHRPNNNSTRTSPCPPCSPTCPPASRKRTASPAVLELTMGLNGNGLSETAWKAEAFAPEVPEPRVNVSTGRWQRC